MCELGCCADRLHRSVRTAVSCRHVGQGCFGGVALLATRVGACWLCAVPCLLWFACGSARSVSCWPRPDCDYVMRACSSAVVCLLSVLARFLAGYLMCFACDSARSESCWPWPDCDYVMRACSSAVVCLLSVLARFLAGYLLCFAYGSARSVSCCLPYIVITSYAPVALAVSCVHPLSCAVPFSLP